MEKLLNKIKPVLYLFAIIWAVFIIDFIFPVDLTRFGIFPRTLTGLCGIMFAPFLHANLSHIMSNSLPFLILGALLFCFYEDKAIKMLLISALLSGVLVWIFARPAIHIGMSGVIYAMASFLIFAGLFRKDFISFIISIVVLALYGGLIWGIFPNNFYISWEGHICGAVAGGWLAYVFYKKKKQPE